VLDTGDTVTFRVRVRDLTPTFGSPNGAQLIDVYVHDPAASSTSTAASFPQRNYRISAAGAWSRLLEVQGFGQRFVDASGATLGTISIRADDISRYITFSVPRSALGNPGPGWGFAVALTAQDGFSPDQARSFASTPQPFNLGRCATESADPHCTFPLAQLPKVMDALPSGPDALDYTVHSPVTLSPAVMP
jgi:carbohydrate-binding DOMON domain-containing protein